MFPKKLNRFYWNIVKQFPIRIACLIFIATAFYLIERAAAPFVDKWIVQILQDATNSVVSNALWLLIGVFVLRLILELGNRLIHKYVVPIVDNTISTKMYRQIYRNDAKFFTDVPTGQITKYVSMVVSNFHALTIGPITQVIGFLVGMGTIMTAVIRMDSVLFVIVLGAAIARCVWEIVWQHRVNKNQVVKMRVAADISGCRVDGLDNALVVKTNGNTDIENDYIWGKQLNKIALDKKTYNLRIFQRIPAAVVSSLTQIVVIMFAWYLISQGQITIADGVFALAAVTTFSSGLARIFDMVLTYSEKYAETVKAYDAVIVPQSVVDAPGARNLTVRGGAGISMKNVSFAYDNGKRVFKDFDLNIAPGERVGIVGLSGAGKTTLTNLILRMYDVTDGAVRVAGHDVRDVTQNSLRKNIAVVPQETSLFNRSILENIRYGCPRASRAMVIRAAKRAHIHNFIMGLPDGYDTLVGNRGIKLSGGQKQRVAIARAILRNAPILLLDEATSALDSESEMYIQSALDTVMRDKTTIAIAHRLSTLRNMNRIVVIHRGKIVESGTHDELLKQNGTYNKLWNMQTNGFV